MNYKILIILLIIILILFLSFIYKNSNYNFTELFQTEGYIYDKEGTILGTLNNYMRFYIDELGIIEANNLVKYDKILADNEKRLFKFDPEAKFSDKTKKQHRIIYDLRQSIDGLNLYNNSIFFVFYINEFKNNMTLLTINKCTPKSTIVSTLKNEEYTFKIDSNKKLFLGNKVIYNNLKKEKFYIFSISGGTIFLDNKKIGEINYINKGKDSTDTNSRFHYNSDKHKNAIKSYSFRQQQLPFINRIVFGAKDENSNGSQFYTDDIKPNKFKDIFNGFIGRINILGRSLDQDIICSRLDCKTINALNCNYKPKGINKAECKQLCNIESNCSPDLCKIKCDNCLNLDCKWVLSDYYKNEILTPKRIKLRGFSGNEMIKLSWLRPLSETEILNYYILIKENCADYTIYGKSKCPKNNCVFYDQKCNDSPNHNLKILKYNNDSEIIEYYIKNIKNNISHSVYVLAKNKYGMSELSNKVTIIPNKNSELSSQREDSFDNSVENLYNQLSSVDFQLQNDDGDKINITRDQVSNYISNLEYTQLQNILMKDKNRVISGDTYKINIL